MRKLIKLVSILVGLFVFFMISLFVGFGISAAALAEKTTIDHENKTLVIELSDKEYLEVLED